MGLTTNDLQTRAWVKYNLNAASTQNDLTGGLSCRIMAVSLTPAAAVSTLVMANAATVTGTDLIHMQAGASGATSFVYFGGGGVHFATGLSTTMAGAGAFGEVYVLLDT